MIKVLAPNVACQVLDWAIQAHGGGACRRIFRSPTCTPIRARCASPTADEVHRNAIAKLELSKHLPAPRR